MTYVTEVVPKEFKLFWQIWHLAVTASVAFIFPNIKSHIGPHLSPSLHSDLCNHHVPLIEEDPHSSHDIWCSLDPPVNSLCS